MKNIKVRAWDTKLEKYHIADYRAYEGVLDYLMMKVESGIVLQYPLKEPIMKEDTERFELELFTGLTDKNGIEICEGDVLESYGHKYIVKFGKCPDTGVTCFYLENVDEDWTTYNLIDNIRNNIVGNINENKELLDTTD